MLTLTVAMLSLALMLTLIVLVGILSAMDRPARPDVARIIGAVQRRQAARGEDCP